VRAQETATLAIAGVAVLGCIGSVLLLAFRVGRLTGEITARQKAGEDDRIRLWQALGALTDRINTHVERRGIRHDH
jgi:hypothetical protein